LYQLAGRVPWQAGAVPARWESLPTSWQCSSLAGEPPNSSQPAGNVPAWRESLLASWHHTSLLGEHPDQLALHQLFGRAFLPAGNVIDQQASPPADNIVAQQESLPTSWQLTSLAGEPPDQLVYCQLAGWLSRQAVPASREVLPTSWSGGSLKELVQHQLSYLVFYFYLFLSLPVYGEERLLHRWATARSAVYRCASADL
jgi:hypothetical protein